MEEKGGSVPGADPPEKSDLAGHREANDDGEQRRRFDQSGEDDTGNLDAGAHLGLPRHAFDCLAANAPNADAGTDDAKTGTQTSTNRDQALRIRASGVSGSLEQRKNRVNHDQSPIWKREPSAPADCPLVRQRDACVSTDLAGQLDRLRASAAGESALKAQWCALMVPMNTLANRAKMKA
jgi:hypothetical protein